MFLIYLLYFFSGRQNQEKSQSLLHDFNRRACILDYTPIFGKLQQEHLQKLFEVSTKLSFLEKKYKKMCLQQLL
jgi:hypothetical protein